MSKRNSGGYRNFIFLFVALVIFFLGFTFAKTRVYLASLALTPSSAGDVIVVSEVQDNGLTKVELRIRTGTNKKDVAVRLSVSSADSSNIKLVNKDGGATSNITPNEELVSTGYWQFPTNRTETKEGEIVVDFAAVNVTKDGYSSKTYENIASFYLTGVKSKDNLQFKFDENLSQMFSKRRPVTDIWE